MRIRSVIKLGSEDIIKRAIGFFGAGGAGLTIKEQNSEYVLFEGGGGNIEMTIKPRMKATSVEFVTQEWEQQVKQFIDSLPHLSGKTLTFDK